MRSNLLWLVVIVVIAAMGAWISRERAPREVGAPGTYAPYTPTDAEEAEAHRLLFRTDLPQAENERRLAFYNDLRDRMDQKAFGVLEAVARMLRGAPGYRVSLGYDLKTFYSAVGGDRDFKGGRDEDWSRLLSFEKDWLDVIVRSPTARIARFQTVTSRAGFLGAGGPRPPMLDAESGVPSALEDLPDSAEQVMDAHEVKILNAVCHQLCELGDQPLAREAFRKLGSYVDWRGFPQAEKLEAYRAWTEGRGPRP